MSADSVAVTTGFLEKLCFDPAALLPEEARERVLSLPDIGGTLAIADDPHALGPIGLIGACLDSQNLSDLYHIQRLRQQRASTGLLVLFDVEAARDLARLTALGALEAFFQSTLPVAHGDPLEPVFMSAAPTAQRDVAGQPTEFGFRLTRRQCDVLFLIREGRSNKEIANRLDCSEGTVKLHCMAVFRALGVANRTQAAIMAERLVLSPPVQTSSPASQSGFGFAGACAQAV